MEPPTLRRLITRSGLWLVILSTATSAPAIIRDGGIDPANLGKGDWVYYLSALTSRMGGNVPSVTNIASYMAYEKSQGIRYIIVKAASGSTLYPSDSSPQFTTSLVNAAHAAGLLIFGYNRSGQGGVNVAGEVAVADFVFNRGADGFVWDAESEWEIQNVPDNLNLAWQICSQTRSNWPTKFLAHAPFPIISYHSSFPYKEFGYWSDTVMPQIYHYGWTGVKRSPSGGINWSDVNWHNWENSLIGQSDIRGGVRVYWTNSIKPLAPINHVYGPNPPNSGVSHIPDNNVLEFIDYLSADPHSVTTGGYKGVSFWRADLHGAVQWANIKGATIGDFPDVVNNIVIDSPNVTRVGSWTSTRTFYNGAYYGNGSGTDTNSFGTNYLTRAQGTGSAYIQFTPNIIVTGDYDVYQWHPFLANASASVPHIVTYNGGSTTVFANQTTNAGKWSLLGRFNFAEGTNGNIQVMDNIAEADKVAIADGVKLVFVPLTNAPPVIVTQPQQQTIAVGQKATFNVVASGSLPLAYQWRLNGTPIPGATGPALVLNNVQSSNSGSYSVVVTNSLAAATSSNASLTVLVPFSITDVAALPRPTSALITWATTSNATSQVEYGVTTNYESLSPLNANSTTSHAVLLIGLVPDTNYFFRARSRVGTNEFKSADLSFSTDVSIIVDNPDAAYNGLWTLGAAPDQYGEYYQYAYTVADLATADATYSPNIAIPGKYDVAVWYPQGNNRTTNAPVLVASDEDFALVRVNQTVGGGAWHLVAAGKSFSAGTSGFVRILNDTGEADKVVIADAVRWKYTASQDNHGDGTVPDWWANYYFGSNVDASVDHDGDGYSTYAEYVSGTLATDPSSHLNVRVEPNSPNGLRVTFSPYLPGRVYELQSTADLTSGAWLTLSNSAVATGSPTEGSIAAMNAGGTGRSFYRLSIRLTP